MRRPSPFLAALLLPLVVGCAAKPWPKVRAAAAPDYAAGAVPIARIDVMPMDVDLAAREGYEVHPDELRRRFDTSAAAAVLSGLTRAGYQVNPLEWNGTSLMADGTRAVALAPNELEGTASAFASYTRVIDDPRVAGPALPVRLGAATGADATLYVGGEAYVGKKPTSKAAKVGKVVLIGLAVVAIVALVVIAARSGGGDVLGNVASGVGRAASGVARAAGNGASIALRGAARATDVAGRVVLRSLDAMGNANINVQVNVDVTGNAQPAPYRYDTPQELQSIPEPIQVERLQRKGGSKTWLTMVLVDNRTGRVLWHATQKASVSPADHGGVTKVVDRLLASLPPPH